MYKTSDLVRLSPERSVFRWVIGLSVVLNIGLLISLLVADFSLLVILTFVPLTLVASLLVAFHIKKNLESNLYSLANVIESLRVGDYSLRLNEQKNEGAWSSVFSEINQLAATTQKQRWQSIESNILLDKLLAEFDIPVFVFDKNGKLQNINQSVCRLFCKEKAELIGLFAQQLQMGDIIAAESGQVIEHWFPKQGGRWELRKNIFIQDGQRYSLLFINDLSQKLREEERLAWQRLVRVLGHELNNSLASIISVSDNLLARSNDKSIEVSDPYFTKSLSVITERSHSLLRFTESYTRLAKLPMPKKTSVDLSALFKRITVLLDGKFVIKQDEDIEIQADPDQLEQMFINLLKNAVEASSNTSEVIIDWQNFEEGIRINIIDNGSGLPESDNLFVPFFTTKEKGNGIGLFLCRQIVEAHDGSISLNNRNDNTGCEVKVWLPS